MTQLVDSFMIMNELKQMLYKLC